MYLKRDVRQTNLSGKDSEYTSAYITCTENVQKLVIINHEHELTDMNLGLHSERYLVLMEVFI